MSVFRYATFLLVASLLLSACSSFGGSVTCTFLDWSVSCGVNPKVGQDLLAQGAKDEKPVKPFEESHSGSEEATP